jgi:hypothetical protein
MQVTGIIVFEDLEGGFWGIVSPDGNRYEIENEIPSNVAEPGMEVEAQVEPTGGVSFRQWGKPVKVMSIRST